MGTSAPTMAGAGEFDHHSTEFASHWRAQYSHMRAACPVAHTNARGGFVVVTRYADAIQVLRDTTGFSAARHIPGAGDVGGVTIPRNPVRMGMMETDPPEHTAYRRLLQPWFSGGAVEAWRPRLALLVDWSLDQVCERGEMDVIADLAHVLPGVVTLDLLGLPLERYHAYAEALGGAAYYVKGSISLIRELLRDLETQVAQARVSPVPGSFLERLLNSEAGEGRVDDATAVNLLFMLLNGGFDTSSALIAHMVLHLESNPSDRDRISADRALIPAAVEELLRYYAPATGVARTATRDTTVGSVPIASGERVLVAFGSANADGEKFSHADDFDLQRTPNPHLSYGSGVHRCLGAILASTEIAILLDRLLTRLPDLQVLRDGVEPHSTAPLVNGYRRVPVTFTPSPRLVSVPGELPPPAGLTRAAAITPNP